MPEYDLTNKKYGSLIVKERSNLNKKTGIWKCQCSCGAIKHIAGCDLTNGLIIRCRECTLKINNASCWVGELPLHYWRRMLVSAKRRKILVNITPEEALSIFLKQDRKCALSGVNINFPPYTSKYHLGNASLDRKDSNIDYTIDNIQWIHKDLNRMKSDFNEKSFIDWCKKVCSYN